MIREFTDKEKLENGILVHPLLVLHKLPLSEDEVPIMLNADNTAICRNVAYKDMENLYDDLTNIFDLDDFIFIRYVCTSKQGVSMDVRYIPDRRFKHINYLPELDLCNADINSLCNVHNLKSTSASRKKERCGVIIQCRTDEQALLLTVMGITDKYRFKV